MVKVTLTDPDMTRILAHVAAVMGERGVTEFTDGRNGHRSWQLPNGKQLTVGWNHQQQKVIFVCGHKLGKYQHVSLSAYEDQYFARMTAWIKHNVSFLAAGEKIPPVSARKGAAKKRAAKTQVAAVGSYDLCSQLMSSLSNVLVLAEKLISQNPTTDVDVLIPRALTIQAAKDVLAAARKKYKR